MIYEKELIKVEEKIDVLIEYISDEFTKKETKRLMSSGGKRLRALFMILAAKVGTVNEECYEAAASLELLHASSLIHDDIIDHGKMRRGEKTTVNIYGSEKAVSVGSILSIFAIDSIISMNNEKASIALIDTLEILCLGELKQLDERYNFNIDYQDYIERISKKTASLFALSCSIGGFLSKIEEDIIKILYEIGFNIGCSFQILDDILDINSSRKETGKICGQDIRGGILTLPYLILMEKEPCFKNKVCQITSKSQDFEFDEVINEVVRSGVLEEAYIVSNTFLDKASELMSKIESVEVGENFRGIIKKLYRKV